MSDHLVNPTIDKSTWGEGPWQTEPDRVEWEHAGLPCLALRNHHGNWCGYAAVPPGHSLHGGGFEGDLEVHGGITYGSPCAGAICHVPAPGEPDDVFWHGFDCGHAGDYMPAMAVRLRESGFERAAAPYDHAAAVAAHGFLVDVYRTLDYVRAETNRLAEQLAARA